MFILVSEYYRRRKCLHETSSNSINNNKIIKSNAIDNLISNWMFAEKY